MQLKDCLNNFKIASEASNYSQLSIFLLKLIINSWRERKGNLYQKVGLDVIFYLFYLKKNWWTFALNFSKNYEWFEKLFSIAHLEGILKCIWF